LRTDDIEHFTPKELISMAEVTRRVTEVRAFHNSLAEISQHVSNLESRLSKEQLRKFVETLLKHTRIFAYGAGRSGLVAKAFVQRLNHIEIQAFFIGDTFTPSFGKEDILVVISGSGDTESTFCFASKAKTMGGKVAVLTAHGESRIAAVGDYLVLVPGKTRLVETRSVAPFTSLFDVAALATLDSVVAELMRRKGVSEELILRLHASLE